MPKRSSIRLTKSQVDAAEPGGWLWDAGVTGFGLRVTKAGSRSFIIRYRNPGGDQKYAVIGKYPTLTVEQARAEAQVRLAEVARGEDPTAKRKALREAPTLTDLADEYLGTYATSRSLKPKTIRDARGVLRIALAAFGGKKVVEITTADVRKVHGEARKIAGVYQANKLVAVLSKMFSLAAEVGWRSGDNPCRGVRKFPEDQRWRNLSEIEVARLLDACDEYENPNAANAVRLLLFTGARLQEVLKAEWWQFDLERGLWEKPSAHTKQQRQHRLELEGPALDLLRQMRQQDPLGRFLFPGEPLVTASGEVLARARADLKRPWRWLVNEAALENVQLHDLRRTTASFMLSGGASLPTVGKALGHTQASTTARYAHLSQDVQREALRGAGERMAALRGAHPKGTVLPIAQSGATRDKRS